jgi:hypothetical protein
MWRLVYVSSGRPWRWLRDPVSFDQANDILRKLARHGFAHLRAVYVCGEGA